MKRAITLPCWALALVVQNQIQCSFSCRVQFKPTKNHPFSDNLTRRLSIMIFRYPMKFKEILIITIHHQLLLKSLTLFHFIKSISFIFFFLFFLGLLKFFLCSHICKFLLWLSFLVSRVYIY
eukprot:NODE_43_length_33755_cov_1.178542.p33 type:complete len:122 gc:universal NODE_43_length_33755_cov_1.178542:6781-6416(-)